MLDWLNSNSNGYWMSFQGIEFTPEMRKLVVNVKHFFDLHKQDISHYKQNTSTLTAEALGVSQSTVKVIMAAFNKKGEDGLTWSNRDNRGKPSYSLSGGVETNIRQFVRAANAVGEQITVDILAKYLTDHLKCNIASTTLWRALKRWGFEFGEGVRSAQLKESERIIIQRRRYLREKLSNRNLDGTTIRPEIYLDESYINKNYARDNTWYFGEDGPILGKPTGKGDRFVILHAIGQKIWVPHAKLVFKATRKTGDYHANMNWNVFKTWFNDQLLPNLPRNSIIIMDNAPYHNVLAEDAFPKSTHSLKILREWLTHNAIPWHKDMLKIELLELCRRFSPEPEFALDRIAVEQGYSILRTPPYHPELQPIETCWAVVKGYVAANNDCSSMDNVRQLLETGFNKVTEKTMHGIIKKVRAQEDRYWVEDSKYFDHELNDENKD